MEVEGGYIKKFGPLNWPAAEESAAAFSKKYEFWNAIYCMKTTSNKIVVLIQSCSEYMN